jgi:hypothetical protein
VLAILYIVSITASAAGEPSAYFLFLSGRGERASVAGLLARPRRCRVLSGLAPVC